MCAAGGGQLLSLILASAVQLGLTEPGLAGIDDSGKYQLKGFLGQGRVCEVFHYEHEAHGDVAVKVSS